MVTNMPNKVQFDGRPVWAEVKLSALTHNLRAIQRHLASRRKAAGAKSGPPKVLAVVKANAYGHGAVPVARALAKAGADWFGVTCSAEGIELREGGIRKPILLLTGFWEGEEKRIIQHNLTPAVTRCEQLWSLDRAAAKARHGPALFHLKIDTGMNRLGLAPSDVPRFAKTLASCPHLRLQGIFTHFASSEEFTHDKTERQRQAFEVILERLRELKIEAPLIHLANSAAVVSRPETWAGMVRPGLILYGHHQSYQPPQRDTDAAEMVPLRPVLSLRARIISLRDIPPGQGVGYNSRWTASRPSRVAVIAIGYADGLPRGLTNKGRVIVRGQFAPLVGTVSMDLSAVDVTDVAEVRLGDVATIYGSDGQAAQQVSDVAKVLGTVTSDLCCDLGPRVPRIYLP
jgi:alanine racemase